MKKILCISFSSDAVNTEEVVELFGIKATIIHYSTNLDVELTIKLIEKFDGKVDVISITGLPPKLKFKGGYFLHPESFKIRAAAIKTPFLDGQFFKEIYIPITIRKLYLKNPSFLSSKKIGFYSGALQKSFVEVFEDLDNKILMADPYFFLRTPLLLEGKSSLDKFLKFFTPFFKYKKISKNDLGNFEPNHPLYKKVIKEFISSDILVGNEGSINFLDLDHVKGKTLILDVLTNEFKEKLSKHGLKEAIVCLPTNKYPFINYSILEAFLQLKKDKGLFFNEEDVLNAIDELGIGLEHFVLNEDYDSIVKFAFVIHPLSTKYLFKHPLLKPFKKYSKPFEKISEDLLTLSPGFFYGKIDGIVSEKNGRKVQGLIYTITETPKKLIHSNPATIYNKILKLCESAKKRDAKIIGLGAYTKIVGDAGVTISRMSPIPVTTGNSLSAASTLWAAKYAVDKMGIVSKVDGQYKGSVMVVGATGSIGAVSAKILSMFWDEVIIVAPRIYKLVELKEEILKISPKCKVELTTRADDLTFKTDLIVTTTSSQGEKILDIQKVKPGAVICDVSRPFDIKEDEVVLRPDVLVIASGEVELPGNVDMKIDLGLDGSMVYACLAETALLALEGKYESFTLSRNISFEKVLEIDQLAKEHGVRLSQIMGHHGVITEEEIKICRELALRKLSK